MIIVIGGGAIAAFILVAIVIVRICYLLTPSEFNDV
jgi:hypothetical protein